MAAKYTSIRAEIWNSPEMEEKTIVEKSLVFSVLSGPVSTPSGFYILQRKQLRNDLCRFDKELDDYDRSDIEIFNNQIWPAFIREQKLWIYDQPTEQILIPDYFRDNRTGGPKSMKSIANAVATLKLCPLSIKFLISLRRHLGDEQLKLFHDSRPDLMKSIMDYSKAKKLEEDLKVLEDLPYLNIGDHAF